MRVPIKLDNIDTLAVSGHKIHAPKGIGALYLSDRLVQAFQPPYLGGEQERGLRPGTENLPYAMGLAAAAARLAKTMKSRDTAMRALNQRLRDGLAAFPEVVLNSPADAVPEVLNFSENCIKSWHSWPKRRSTCPRPVPAAGASPATRWRLWAGTRWPSTPPSGCPFAPTTPRRTWMPF